MSKIDWTAKNAHARIALQTKRLKEDLLSEKQKVGGYTSKYNEINKKLQQIKEENMHLKQTLGGLQSIFSESESDSQFNSFRKKILQNLLDNEGKTSSVRRFSQQTLEISRLLRNISPKCYRILHQVFQLPSEQTIDGYFKTENKFFEKVLTDFHLIPSLIEQYRKVYHLSDTIFATLAIDAAALDRPTCNNDCYVFLFYLQPLDYHQKCLPLHLYTKSNGNGNKSIVEISSAISKILLNENIKIVSICTDGDPTYNDAAMQTFSIYSDCIDSGVQAMIEKIKESDTIPFVGDPLHAAKLSRKRIIKGRVAVDPSIGFNWFNAENINNILHLGQSLMDNSSLGFMKDFYVLKIFNIQNLISLYGSADFEMALYLYPVTFWIESIMNSNIDIPSRLFLLESAFWGFFSFFKLNKTKTNPYVTINNTQNSIAQTYASYIFCIRAMNTLIMTIYILKNFENVSLDRIGTHPLENFFGNIRYGCNNFDSFDNFLKNVVKALTNTLSALKHAIRITIANRINIGGTKIDKDMKWFPVNFIGTPYNFSLGFFVASDIHFSSHAYYNETDFDHNIGILSKSKDDLMDSKNRIHKPKHSTGVLIKSRCINAFFEKEALKEKIGKMISKEEENSKQEIEKILHEQKEIAFNKYTNQGQTDEQAEKLQNLLITLNEILSTMGKIGINY